MKTIIYESGTKSIEAYEHFAYCLCEMRGVHLFIGPTVAHGVAAWTEDYDGGIRMVGLIDADGDWDFYNWLEEDFPSRTADAVGECIDNLGTLFFHGIDPDTIRCSRLKLEPSGIWRLRIALGGALERELESAGIEE